MKKLLMVVMAVMLVCSGCGHKKEVSKEKIFTKNDQKTAIRKTKSFIDLISSLDGLKSTDPNNKTDKLIKKVNKNAEKKNILFKGSRVINPIEGESVLEHKDNYIIAHLNKKLFKIKDNAKVKKFKYINAHVLKVPVDYKGITLTHKEKTIQITFDFVKTKTGEIRLINAVIVDGPDLEHYNQEARDNKDERESIKNDVAKLHIQ